MLTSPKYPILELGLTELIGVDEQVAQNQYSASVAITLDSQPVSGEILAFALFATETGTGAVLQATGKLILLDADPAVAAGDAALAVGEWPTVLGIVDFASGDWLADTGGACAYVVDTPVAFHALTTIYATFFYTLATTFNSAAGDEEQLRFNAWYRKDG